MSEPKPIAFVKFRGIQSGFGPVPTRALFDVVSATGVATKPVQPGCTVTIETLEADGYQVREAATQQEAA